LERLITLRALLVYSFILLLIPFFFSVVLTTTLLSDVSKPLIVTVFVEEFNVNASDVTVPIPPPV
jgi:hypothetical protein